MKKLTLILRNKIIRKMIKLKNTIIKIKMKNQVQNILPVNLHKTCILIPRN